MPHYFYLARCCDGSLYAGSCVDLKKREAVHNRGDGAKYTRSKRPVKMIYSEEFGTLVEARRREAHVKGWTKEKKERLIHGAAFGHYEKRWYHPISMKKANVPNPHVEKIYFEKR